MSAFLPCFVPRFAKVGVGVAPGPAPGVDLKQGSASLRLEQASLESQPHYCGHQRVTSKYLLAPNHHRSSEICQKLLETRASAGISPSIASAFGRGLFRGPAISSAPLIGYHESLSQVLTALGWDLNA